MIKKHGTLQNNVTKSVRYKNNNPTGYQLITLERYYNVGTLQYNRSIHKILLGQNKTQSNIITLHNKITIHKTISWSMKNIQSLQNIY